MEVEKVSGRLGGRLGKVLAIRENIGNVSGFPDGVTQLLVEKYEFRWCYRPASCCASVFANETSTCHARMFVKNGLGPKRTSFGALRVSRGNF